MVLVGAAAADAQSVGQSQPQSSSPWTRAEPEQSPSPVLTEVSDDERASAGSSTEAQAEQGGEG